MLWQAPFRYRLLTSPDYLEGLVWVYCYAPFASDLIGCSTLKCGDRNFFQFGMSFMHFQQLRSILSSSSECSRCRTSVLTCHIQGRPLIRSRSLTGLVLCESWHYS